MAILFVSKVSGVIETDSVRPGGNVERRKGIVVIDLTEVAERINALDGWRIGTQSDARLCLWGPEDGAEGNKVDVRADGFVKCVGGMPLLPVLQIVAEAMAHE